LGTWTYVELAMPVRLILFSVDIGKGDFTHIEVLEEVGIGLLNMSIDNPYPIGILPKL